MHHLSHTVHHCHLAEAGGQAAKFIILDTNFIIINEELIFNQEFTSPKRAVRQKPMSSDDGV